MFSFAPNAAMGERTAKASGTFFSSQQTRFGAISEYLSKISLNALSDCPSFRHRRPF